MFKLLLQKLGTGASVRSVSFEENILKSAVFVALKLFHVSCFICPTPFPPVPIVHFCSHVLLVFSYTNSLSSLFLLTIGEHVSPLCRCTKDTYTTKLSISNPNNSKNTTTQNCTSHKTLLLHPPPPSLSLPTKTQWYTFVAATNVVWFFPPPIP